MTWEKELQGAIRAELERLTAGSIRPTTAEERQVFVELSQTGHIRLDVTAEANRVRWTGFATRLVADLIRSEARYSSLWARFEEQDAEVEKLKAARKRKK